VTKITEKQFMVLLAKAISMSTRTQITQIDRYNVLNTIEEFGSVTNLIQKHLSN